MEKNSIGMSKLEKSTRLGASERKTRWKVSLMIWLKMKWNEIFQFWLTQLDIERTILCRRRITICKSLSSKYVMEQQKNAFLGGAEIAYGPLFFLEKQRNRLRFRWTPTLAVYESIRIATTEVIAKLNTTINLKTLQKEQKY